MKLSLAQRLYLGLFAGYAIVITVGILSLLSYQKQVRQAEWVQHTQEVLNTVGSLKQLASQLETIKRNVYVTGNTQLAYTFDSTANALDTTLGKLGVLVRNNPEQSAYFLKLQASASDVVNYYKQMPDSPAADTTGLRQTIRAGTSLMNIFYQHVDHFEQHENLLLAERDELHKKSDTQAISMLIGGLLLILLIVSVLSYQVYHELIGRVKSQRQLKHNLKEMEALIAETTQQNWQLTGLSTINDLLQGQAFDDAPSLANACAGALSTLLDVPSVIVYQHHENEKALAPIGTFAAPDSLPEFMTVGVGITGQAALSHDITVVSGVDTTVSLPAGIGSIKPKALALVPLWSDDQLIGLMELISLTEFSPQQLHLLDLLSHNIARALQRVLIRRHLESLITQISEQKEELEAAQDVLTEQANALEQSSRYKSEFLANMSHELRTPLNSILILANLLAENKEGRLSDKQKEYSTIIHKSGSDLLNLINDILDLSKIEAGKIDLLPEDVSVATLAGDMEDLFRHVAAERQIHFVVANQLDTKTLLFTDKKRVEQILKNLLSNALKFTPAAGSVTLTVSTGKNPEELSFAVKDTGTGIAEEYQTVIFEAFQQVDGATNRKFGGTGLGLSISKHLAEQLGGSLALSSALGKGSEFTLYLPSTGPSVPVRQTVPSAPKTQQIPLPLPSGAIVVAQGIVADDRDQLTPDRRILLIIEDDENFATILRDFARTRNYHAIVALTGEEGLFCARKYKPAAILLDIHLPGLSGTEILNTLKRTPELARIPIHIITSHDDLGHLADEITGITIKPFEVQELDAIFNRLADPKQPLEPTPPTKTSTPSIKQAVTPIPPVVNDASAPHEPVDIRLDGYKILLTDDDMRNVYALTAMLETHGAEVLTATNGEEAIAQLNADPSIQLVLMDIMMPVKDGYETMREIRQDPRWSQLPIIAVSAKAMAGDSQKAIDAGASDYLSKPIDRNKLLTQSHKWLTQWQG